MLNLRLAYTSYTTNQLFCQHENKPRQKFIIAMRWNRFQLCMGKDKKRGHIAPAHSCKYVTILKVPSNIVIGDEPLKILLKYAVCESVAEFVDECIQTRFGGVGLPTAIKDLKEIVTYSGNVVAVQVYLRLLRFGAVSNTGVSIAPILVSLDGAVHQCFNLTHVVKMGVICWLF